MKLTKAQIAMLNRTRDQWAAVNPDAFLTGSIVQARNVIEMARADILTLFDVAAGRAALKEMEKTDE